MFIIRNVYKVVLSLFHGFHYFLYLVQNAEGPCIRLNSFHEVIAKTPETLGKGLAVEFVLLVALEIRG